MKINFVTMDVYPLQTGKINIKENTDNIDLSDQDPMHAVSFKNNSLFRFGLTC